MFILSFFTIYQWMVIPLQFLFVSIEAISDSSQIHFVEISAKKQIICFVLLSFFRNFAIKIAKLLHSA